MKRKPAKRLTTKLTPTSEDYDEQDLRLKATGKKKRIVSKYKPSRHSR